MPPGGGTNLGTAHGTVSINGAPALAALAALRRSSASTVGALNTNARAFQQVGAGLAGVGLVIAYGFKVAIDKAAQLDKRLSYTNAIMNTTTENAEKIRKKVIQLGQDSAYTANEVADGFTELAKAGASTEQLLGGVGDAMITLGQSADIALDDAAKALVSISATYGLQANQASHIADVIQGAANAAIIEVSDMAVSFKYAGGVAAQLGVSLEDTATSISILGNAGIKGSTAGTSLRRILLQLTPRTLKAAAAMKDLGILTKEGSNQFYDAKGNAKSLSDIFQLLQDKTKDLTAEQRQEAFATIFGDRAINSALALSKAGAKGFEEYSKAIAKTSAAEIAAKRLDNLAGAIEILKGTLDSAFIAAGTPAQKPVTELVRAITKLVNVFNHLPGPVQQFLVFALLAVGVLSLLAGGFLLTVGVMFRAGALFIQLAQVFRIVAFNLRILTYGMRAFTLSLLTNPVFLIIAAVILLAVGFYLLWKRSEKFREAVKSLGRAFAVAWKWIVDFAKKLPGYLAKAFQKTVEWIKKNWDLLVPILIGPIGLLVIAFKRFHKQIFGFFKDIGKTVGNAFKSAGSAIASFAKTIAKWVAGVAVAAFQKFIWFLQNLPKLVGFALGFVIGRILKWGAELVALAIIFGYKFIRAYLQFLISLPGRVWGILKAVLKAVFSFGFSFVREGNKIGFNFIVNLFKFLLQLPGRLASLIATVTTKIIQFGIWFVTKALQLGWAFVQALFTFLLKLPGRIVSLFSTVVQKVLSFYSALFSAAWKLGKAIFDGLWGAISGIPGLIKDVFLKAVSAITNLVSSAWDAGKKFAGGLWHGFKNGLGIKSPSFIEKSMVAIGDQGEATIGHLGKQVRTLQRLGSGLPNVTMGSSVSGVAASTRGASKGMPAYDDRVAASTGRTVVIEKLEVNNPRKERASDSLQHQVEKLVVIGV